MSDVPVLIRRTTMLVNNIEPSLQIYRDILGMSAVSYTHLTLPTILLV